MKRVQEFLLRPESKRPISKKQKDHKNGKLTNGEIKSKSNGLEIFDKNQRKNSDTITDQKNGIAAIAYTENMTEKLNDSPSTYSKSRQRRKKYSI